MTKIIEMKKSDFLKKIKEYVLKKKESPTKLYMTPDTLSAVKIKFIFAKTHEITVAPDNLLFFKKTLGGTSKAKATDSDTSKTYYFSFFAQLLRELTNAGIYVGKSAGEKLEALSTYLETVKGNKVIFEIIPKVDLNKTNITSGRNEEEKSAEFTMEENFCCSQSLIEDHAQSSESEFIKTTKEEGDTSHGSALHGDIFQGNIHQEDAFFSLFEESRRKLEEQEFVIKGLGDKIESYEKLAKQSDLKIKENKKKIKESRHAAKESNITIETLKATLENLKSENQQLNSMMFDRIEAAQKADASGADSSEEEIKEEVKVDDLEGNDENQDHHVYGNEINDLIAELDQEEVQNSLHLTEAITQWNNRLHLSRGEEIPISVYNREAGIDEKQTIARFIAIAKLERERAAHFANHDTPWPKEEELARVKSEGYAVDLQCFSLYQDFPKELKQFAVMFTFWEAAHHNRFYRNALSAVLNGGNVPDTLGMVDDTRVDTDQTDIMLKLLHYADMTRILMGHYGYIAQNQFNIDLFVFQDENKARFGNAIGDLVNISRTTTEAPLFM